MFARIIALTGCALLTACAGAQATRSADVPAPSLASARGADAPDLTSDEALEIDTLVLGLFIDDEPTRVLSARKLGAFGPKARTALPYLIDCLVRDTDSAANACARAAGRVGAAALPPLERVAAGQPDRRLRVITALTEMGPTGAPLLLRVYRDACGQQTPHDRDVVAASMRALSSVGEAVDGSCATPSDLS